MSGWSLLNQTKLRSVSVSGTTHTTKGRRGRGDVGRSVNVAHSPAPTSQQYEPNTLLKIAQGFGTVSQNHDTSTSLQLAIHDHIEKALVLHKAYFGWKSLWNVVIPQTFFAVHALTFRMKQEWDSSLTLNLHFWTRTMFTDTANSAHDRFSTCVKFLQN